jgi:hypothetical protein
MQPERVNSRHLLGTDVWIRLVMANLHILLVAQVVAGSLLADGDFATLNRQLSTTSSRALLRQVHLRNTACCFSSLVSMFLRRSKNPKESYESLGARKIYLTGYAGYPL